MRFSYSSFVRASLLAWKGDVTAGAPATLLVREAAMGLECACEERQRRKREGPQVPGDTVEPPGRPGTFGLWNFLSV